MSFCFGFIYSIWTTNLRLYVHLWRTLICIGAEALPVADTARRRWSKTTSTKKGAPSPTEYDYVLIRMVVNTWYLQFNCLIKTDLYRWFKSRIPQSFASQNPAPFKQGSQIGEPKRKQVKGPAFLFAFFSMLAFAPTTYVCKSAFGGL